MRCSFFTSSCESDASVVRRVFSCVSSRESSSFSRRRRWMWSSSCIFWRCILFFSSSLDIDWK